MDSLLHDIWSILEHTNHRVVQPKFEPNGCQVEIWQCRNRRRHTRRAAKAQAADGGERPRERNRVSHALEGGEACKIRVRLIVYFKHAQTKEDHKGGLGSCHCVPEWIHIARTEETIKQKHVHNHTLDSLDKFRRSEALLFYARYKVAEGGYSYSAVRRWMQAKYSEYTSQVEHLKISDVANAARPWRDLNRDLELIEPVEDPSAEVEQEKKFLDLLETTTAMGLRRGLAEVCKQMPAAVAIALTHLAAAQEMQKEQDMADQLLEGDDIPIPEPGMPERLRTGSHYKPQYYPVQATTMHSSVAPGSSTLYQQPPIRNEPIPLMAYDVVPSRSGGPARDQQHLHPGQQMSALLPPASMQTRLPAQQHSPLAPGKQHTNIPPYHSVEQSPLVSVAPSLHENTEAVGDWRPSWAKPTARGASAPSNTEEQTVEKQLNAELAAGGADSQLVSA